MTRADEVREHCRIHYINPARARGEHSVTIRTGDVHKALRYRNRYPAVCSALGTKIFEESLHLERISVDGPLNGANTLFAFRL